MQRTTGQYLFCPSCPKSKSGWCITLCSTMCWSKATSPTSSTVSDLAAPRRRPCSRLHVTGTAQWSLGEVPWWCSLTSPRHLIPSHITSSLILWLGWVFVVYCWTGLRTTSPTEVNLLSSREHPPPSQGHIRGASGFHLGPPAVYPVRGPTYPALSIKHQRDQSLR